ncbi:hypothetical protein BGZ63DRAFT_405293 [Mariannaea sp. PMI_226]|nr:hypothetical protein BGZ63DRAFT_405293 [Mariannaea sp. PMI_226]
MFISHAFIGLAVAGAVAGTKITMRVPNWIPWGNITTLDGSVIGLEHATTTVALHCRDRDDPNIDVICNTIAKMTVTCAPATAAYNWAVTSTFPPGLEITDIKGHCKVKGSTPYDCTDTYTAIWADTTNSGVESSDLIGVYDTVIALEVDVTAGASKLNQSPESTSFTSHYPTQTNVPDDSHENDSPRNGFMIGAVVGAAAGAGLIIAVI